MLEYQGILMFYLLTCNFYLKFHSLENEIVWFEPVWRDTQIAQLGLVKAVFVS